MLAVSGSTLLSIHFVLSLTSLQNSPSFRKINQQIKAQTTLQMITAVDSCGCPPKSSPNSYPHFHPPPTPPLSENSPPSNCYSNGSSPSGTGPRQPFENPRLESPNFSKEDGAKCPCPRPGHRNYDSMRGTCSSHCSGVFPERKVVSKIVEGGKPYKEIEAVINDNRMVIRIQRESIESEWEPPCDCLGGNFEDFKRAGRLGGGGCATVGGSSPCGENVVFQKVDHSVGRHSARDDNCRTVTVYPEPERMASETNRESDDNERKDKKEKFGGKAEIRRALDLEENPNIFVLRIRKRSENLDRKNNIDLEFRTPRPWIDRPRPKLAPPEPPTTTQIKIDKKPAKDKVAGKKNKGKK